MVKFFLRQVHRLFRLFHRVWWEGKRIISRQWSKVHFAPSRIQDLKNYLPKGVSNHENVISIPLVLGKNYRHAGGLISSQRQELISEAILYAKNKSCQELPAYHSPADLLDGYFHDSRLLLYGGVLYNHFGHFLVESLGRLWAYSDLEELNPTICFYAPWGEAPLYNKEHFVTQALVGLGIPLLKVHILQNPQRLARILVPEQKYGFGYEGELDPIFRSFVNRFTFRHSVPREFEGANRVYVSRSALPIKKGGPVGEKEFEDFLQVNGYTIVHPERLTLYEQLSVYSQARKIVFCAGSAVHGCILLPNLTADIAVIARQRDQLNSSYHDISRQFRGQTRPLLWIDEVLDQFQYGLDVWDALGVIDWPAVSNQLHQAGFIEKTYKESEILRATRVENERKDYLRQISTNPKHIAFIASQE